MSFDAVADSADGDAGIQCGYVEAGSGLCVPCPANMPSPGQCNFNGVTCIYPGGDCTCTSGCSEGQCCPITCAQLGFPCGPAGDGCGGKIDCGECFWSCVLSGP